MILSVKTPGLFTTVQDLGRWGHQDKGVSVGGAMDPFSLRLGNVLLGNPEGAAALEITFLGPTMEVLHAEGALTLAGPNLGMTVNGKPIPPWTVLTPSKGDVIAFSGPKGLGCRGYLCFSGGVQVPLVMGSRSTHTRSRLGGLEGRPLKAGDQILTGPPDPLWDLGAGLSLERSHLDLLLGENVLDVIPGPQEHMFSPEGIETFYSSSYVVSDEADRMGYRMEGPKVAHSGGADIISDPIPLGAIQVPGGGNPIVMMADRQTTGGYSKIGVLTRWSCARLAQAAKGEAFRFRPVDRDKAIKDLLSFENLLAHARTIRARYRSGGHKVLVSPPMGRRYMEVRLGGRSFTVTVEEI